MATSQMRVIAQPQVRPGQQIQRIMTTVSGPVYLLSL